MIAVNRTGRYRLIQTKGHTRILYLDGDAYAWIYSRGIGEILVASHRPHRTDSLISTGTFYVYDVINEPHLSDQLHLELQVGEHRWQGYVLLTGLPDKFKPRCRIVATKELITPQTSGHLA